MHLKLKLMMALQCGIYYMILFNSVELSGDPIKIGMVFGAAEALGVLLVERLVHLIPDTHG